MYFLMLRKDCHLVDPGQEVSSNEAQRKSYVTCSVAVTYETLPYNKPISNSLLHSSQVHLRARQHKERAGEGT